MRRVPQQGRGVPSAPAHPAPSCGFGVDVGWILARAAHPHSPLPRLPWVRRPVRHALDEDAQLHQCHRRVGHRGPHHASSGRVWGRQRRAPGTRYVEYTDCPGCGGFKAGAALFLPRTLALGSRLWASFSSLLFWCPMPRGLALTFFGARSGPVFLGGLLIANTELEITKKTMATWVRHAVWDCNA